MSGTQLTVTLDGGQVADAQAVVSALEEVFGAPDGLPSDERATVRTATFSGETTAGTPADAAGGGHRLTAPVTVTVQGTPEAVRRARDTLNRAFSARDEGVSAGDQEQERRLRLEP
ncbi:hypothetical protein [Streptomyces sp. NPDC004065]|uniref:hypothetical protein n=1 Tax=Streptomyces sp. NPDC004065 TaxID=3364689 RepID=UPI00385175C3